MNRGLLWIICGVVVGALLAPCALGQGGDASEIDKLVDSIKKPVPWFEWGADLRLRHVYRENEVDLNTQTRETLGVHFFRPRTRLWMRLGPFFTLESLDKPNGLSIYARATHEAFAFVQRQNSEGGNVDEIVLDNLYVDLQRMFGLPVSVRVGRQDIIYGRGWLVVEGTPRDGSRTIYNDAIKLTLHLDPAQTDVDVFFMDNNGFQSRVKPLNEQVTRDRTNEFNMRAFGVYVKNKSIKDQEINAYYFYKDDDIADPNRTPTAPYAPGRIVHTAGALFQGKVLENWDYYAEGAYQWGREGNRPRRGYGMNSDLGFTFYDCPVTPRIHGGYEYLSGDDPSTRTFEAWDGFQHRSVQWSNVYWYRWASAFENGMIGHYANLQRFTVGASAKPMPKMKVKVDYSYLLANEHTFGRTTPYATGTARGSHVEGSLSYNFNRYVAGQILGAWFQPGDYYASSMDDAVYMRWQLIFKF